MEPKKSHKNFLPILNLGTWSRFYAVKSTLDKILDNFGENDPNLKVNIISLGAGYDTMYFLLKQKFTNLKYIEVDYKQVTTKKIALIQKSNMLKSIITNSDQNMQVDEGDDRNFRIEANSNFYSEDYCILDCDITDSDKFLEKLNQLPGFDKSALTIIIAECLLVYIKKETTYLILENLQKNFENIIVLEYDLIGANDSFGKEMILNLHDRGIKLFGYQDIPDSKAQRKRLEEIGLVQCEVISMLDYYDKQISPMEKNRTKHLELFDEFEEFNLLQSHSCFGYGARLEEKYEYLYDVLKFE